MTSAGLKIERLNAYRVKERFDWILVEIRAVDGTVGWGEAYPEPGVLHTLDEMKAIVEGEDALSANHILGTLRRRWPGSPFAAAAAALSGIEIALRDLIGQILGVPVHQLFGGKVRDIVPQYIDCYIGPPGAENTIEGYRDRAAEVVARGFQALKFDLDAPTTERSPRKHFPHPDSTGDHWARRMTPADRRHAVALATAVREAAGDDVELGFDLHWYFPVADGLLLARDLSHLDLAFLEDPVYPRENLIALRRFAENCPAPVLTGELAYTPRELRTWMEAAPIGIVAPETTRCGGVAGTIEAAAAADELGILVSPHNVNSLIATAALAHAAAVIPNLYYVEYRYREESWWDDLVHPVEGRSLTDGPAMRVPGAPGLGVEVNRSLLSEKSIETI